MTSIQQHSQAERPKEQQKQQKSTSSRDSESSDPSYDFVKDLNQKSSLKRTPEEEQDLLYRYKGKHGLKYQKISNELRQKLIKQVTTTGCTIKSAARDLNINFSTAKAIMQIYRKEGRTSKKIKRTKTLEELKNPEQLIQAGLQKEDQCQPRQNTVQDSIETIHYQQVEENNRNQAIIIQQINAQNQYLQGRVNQLQQEKSQLCQNYSYLNFQYNQLQQMVRQTMPPYSKPYQF
ncbi:unnamed protein product (macronuclear) [Paramecium tetraurelia]|uniref:HTH psq-type domain-containing protein n=1 Tax=Paramecium tetraurelia TaxID=5888 RepID=A0C578_PARTE|nr:uncharacterized protein GSPATT00006444001 [Paramecium tetraurelia]CAK65945.1 unnamed protein product [Paramecium tetraurelia]|eukprot:XP_001433342.1 hypothetical protein (macronuclear) [Paramecium tetraurelia strain d4-2]